MKRVFVDTQVWVSLLDTNDAWHSMAIQAFRQIPSSTGLTTTDEVLVEFLNTFCGRGSFMRQMAASYVHRIRHDPRTTVLPQSRASFDAGLLLYEARHDKGYSLVDCVSMSAMRRLGLNEVLTNDRISCRRTSRFSYHNWAKPI
ncbi:MAG: PIN domain-containing protein [Planctomycetes bacterium]|nr:PIN domain-containing protein [Planctomycetota bacterium]